MIRSAICLILVVLSGGNGRNLNSTPKTKNTPPPLLTCHKEKNGQKYFELLVKKEQGFPYQYSCSDGCGFLYEKEQKACLECCKVERKTTLPLTKIKTTALPQTEKKHPKKHSQVRATTRENLVVKSQQKQKDEQKSNGKSTTNTAIQIAAGVCSGAFLLIVLITVIIVKCKKRRKVSEDSEIMMDGVDREAQQRFRQNNLPYSTQETEETASLSPRQEFSETAV